MADKRTIAVRAVFYAPQKNNYQKEALEKGVKVEMEHTPDRNIAGLIARHHLDEDQNYYDKLETLNL